MSKKYNEKTPAIVISAKLGRKLQEDIGEELVEHLRNGGTYEQALDIFDIPSKYGYTPAVAWNSVRFAYAGFPGSESVKPYEGLIPESERKELVEAHKKESGLRHLKNKTGLFGISPEERKRISSKVGKVTGILTLEKRLGIHGLTEEQKAEAQRLSALSRGTSPWTEEQKTYLQTLIDSPLVYLPDKRLNLKKISQDYNARFPTRTARAIGATIRKMGIPSSSNSNPKL